jgi:hypothetical protein
MSGTYLIPLLALILIESVLSLTWNRFYFSHGIVLFCKETQFQVRHGALPLSADAIEVEFDQAFNGQKILFREISPGLIAFREKWFNFRFKSFRYSPLMHGVIITDISSGKYIVKGIANWSFLFVLLYAVWISVPVLSSRGGFVLPVAFLLISIVVYLVQRRRLEQLLSLVANK